MKAKITKSDGTVIEVEGTAEEIAKLIGAPAQPVQFVPYPIQVPVYPTYPTLPGDTLIVTSSDTIAIS